MHYQCSNRKDYKTNCQWCKDLIASGKRKYAKTNCVECEWLKQNKRRQREHWRAVRAIKGSAEASAYVKARRQWAKLTCPPDEEEAPEEPSAGMKILPYKEREKKRRELKKKEKDRAKREKRRDEYDEAEARHDAACGVMIKKWLDFYNNRVLTNGPEPYRGSRANFPPLEALAWINPKLRRKWELARLRPNASAATTTPLLVTLPEDESDFDHSEED